MKLIFKQRFFSLRDSYEIYDEDGNTIFAVKSLFAVGRKFQIYDALGYAVGMVKQKLLSFLPTFELYLGDRQVGTIRKDFTLFSPNFRIDCNGWKIEGAWHEWDYRIYNGYGSLIATVSQELAWTDTYFIDVVNDADVVTALMVVIAIDAEKANRN